MQTPTDFYEKHKKATVIVCDAKTGEPVKAVYEWAQGRKREEPAVYHYPEY